MSIWHCRGTVAHCKKALTIYYALTFALRIQVSAFLTTNQSFNNRLIQLKSTDKCELGISAKTYRIEKDVGAFLISFPELYADESSNDMTSNTSRTMRAWKEYCLGDGGVYFDQRPKALKALNSLLVVKISQSLDLQDGDDSDRAKTRNINVEAAVFST